MVTGRISASLTYCNECLLMEECEVGNRQHNSVKMKNLCDWEERLRELGDSKDSSFCNWANLSGCVSLFDSNMDTDSKYMCTSLSLSHTHAHTLYGSNFTDLMPSKGDLQLPFTCWTLKRASVCSWSSLASYWQLSAPVSEFFFSLFPRSTWDSSHESYLSNVWLLWVSERLPPIPPVPVWWFPGGRTQRCSSLLTSIAIINSLSPGPLRLCQVSASPAEVHCGIAPGTSRRRPRRLVCLVLKRQVVCL